MVIVIILHTHLFFFSFLRHHHHLPSLSSPSPSPSPNIFGVDFTTDFTRISSASILRNPDGKLNSRDALFHIIFESTDLQYPNRSTNQTQKQIFLAITHMEIDVKIGANKHQVHWHPYTANELVKNFSELFIIWILKYYEISILSCLITYIGLAQIQICCVIIK